MKTKTIQHKQYSVAPQPFDAYPKETSIQEALGSSRTQKTFEVAELHSTNWVPNVSGWRLTPTGIEFGSVPSGLFPPGTVTFVDIQDIATDKILGRDTAGSGVIEQLGLGAGLAISGGNLVNSITQYTDELAQDAVGAMVDASLTYVDATPLLQRAALTGAITASAGSNATVLGSFTKAQLDTAVSDGNVLFVGDVPTLAAGVYTPTDSAHVNIDGSDVTMTEAQYMRVGATVTVSGRFTADATAAGLASFEITLPVASNIGAVEDAAGVASSVSATTFEGGEVIGVVANDTAKVSWIAVDTVSRTWSFQFSYQII